MYICIYSEDNKHVVSDLEPRMVYSAFLALKATRAATLRKMVG